MNYLAHLYLSGPDTGVRVGNFIGDYVKGNSYTRYPPSIQKGIILHRKIDTFTDLHPVFRESTRHFQPIYRRYAGVVADIVYDHFLAANWEQFSAQTLKNFVSESHRILMSHYFSLPGTVKQFLPFLIKSRRMEHYQSLAELYEQRATFMYNRQELAEGYDAPKDVYQAYADAMGTYSHYTGEIDEHNAMEATYKADYMQLRINIAAIVNDPAKTDAEKRSEVYSLINDLKTSYDYEAFFSHMTSTPL